MFPSRRVERQPTSSVFSYKWKRKKMRKGEVEKRRKQQQDAETPAGGPSLWFCLMPEWVLAFVAPPALLLQKLVTVPRTRLILAMC
jgi:hypothetical protein